MNTSQVDAMQNITTTQSIPMNNHQQFRTLQSPLLGLLFAVSLLGKTGQGRPYLTDYGQNSSTPMLSQLIDVTTTTVTEQITKDVYQLGNNSDEISRPLVSGNGDFGEDALATNTFYERQSFKGSKRRPNNRRPNYEEDYQETRNRFRKRPAKRRPSTQNYEDYDRPNRRKRRPPMKNRNPGNRRPINQNYYDSNEYGDDYYDDYNYSNEFARQGTTTTESDTDTTTESATTSGSTTTSSSNTTGGYNYESYHTGYGPSNGNENISITYGPPTGPKQDTLGPLFDAWYNHYSKNSVFRRLQELLTPNNFYNHPYDVNYHDNF